MSDETPREDVPMLRVVRGDASPEEVAAIVALLAAAGGGDAAPDRAAGMSLWRKQSQLRTTPRPGPDAWRASAMPR